MKFHADYELVTAVKSENVTLGTLYGKLPQTSTILLLDTIFSLY